MKFYALCSLFFFFFDKIMLSYWLIIDSLLIWTRVFNLTEKVEIWTRVLTLLDVNMLLS